jgi:hypothetical protein
MDDRDDQDAALMLIPLLWATRMMKANEEFLTELASMPLDDPKSVVKRMLVKDQKSTH